MYVHSKELQYWKSEHKDLNGCQDADALDSSRGLFAVADGAGTTLFPAIWARILVRHFVDIPLMSIDPFEVEWWVRLAQDEYKRQIPDVERLLDWSVRQKAQSQGSDSTLATVRITAIDDTSSQALAQLLVFGDSCVIVGDTQTQVIESFVLQVPSEFDQAPICIPSSLKFFNRSFHRCAIISKILEPRHVVVLATDAVSKWILSGGSSGIQWNAFQEVCRQSRVDWPTFIDGCRKRKEMVDDDATALILTFKAERIGDGEPLGAENTHSHPMVRDGMVIDVIKVRKEAFEKAQQAKNSELVAIYYGDGKDLKSAGIDMADEEIKHAQQVADALKEVMRVFRQAQNTPGLTAKVEPVWRQYGHLLQNERCADNIRETLQRNGVNLALPRQFELSDPAPTLAQPGEPVVMQNQPPEGMSAEVSEQLADRLERQALQLNFLQAYRDEDDNAILAAFETIESARLRYPNLPAFGERETWRIAQAQTHRQTLQKLKRALSEGLVEEIETAYNSMLINEKSLTPDELKRVELAHRLSAAFREADDEAIVAIYNQILSGYQKFFTFTPQEQRHINAARQRREALLQIQVALKSGSLQQIANTYDPILDNYKSLTEQEKQLVALAQEFVVAFRANDDEAIVHANEKIMDSSYYWQFIAFTENERSRIAFAEASVKTQVRANMLVVATVKDQRILLEQVRKVCRVKEPYINYRIRLLQQQAKGSAENEADQEVDLQIAYLKSEVDPQQLPYFALENLINDKLIRVKIAEENQQGVSMDDFNVEGWFSSVFEEFRKYAVSNYDEFLKSNKLTDDDVEQILLLLLRRELFVTHYQNQQKPARFKSLFKQKPMLLDDWLERQKKEPAVIYTQYSSERHQRGLWLYGLLQPEK